MDARTILDILETQEEELVEAMLEAHRDAARYQHMEYQVFILSDGTIDIRAVPAGDNSWIEGSYTVYCICFRYRSELLDWCEYNPDTGSYGEPDIDRYMRDCADDIMDNIQWTLDNSKRELKTLL